jgi:hypothetical protein
MGKELEYKKKNMFKLRVLEGGQRGRGDHSEPDSEVGEEVKEVKAGGKRLA